MAILTSFTVTVMSNDDWWFVCGMTGHIGHRYPDVQCYNCKMFSHLTQDCPNTIPPSGTTIETDHNPLTTEIATEDALTSHDHTTDPTVAEALANYQRLSSCSPSSHCSSSHYPLTNWCPRWHSHQKPPHQFNCYSSRPYHFFHQSHSQGCYRPRPI